MCGSNFLLGSSSFDCRNVGKIFIFVSLSLSLSYFFSSSSPLFSFSPSIFLSYPPNLLFFLFVSPFHFLIFLLFLSFFLSFIFSSISFSSFSLFYFPFGFHQLNGPKVGETSPHFPPLPLLTLNFFSYFHDFSFSIISSFDTWLNVSHSHKCTTWLMPGVTPLGFHVAST